MFARLPALNRGAFLHFGLRWLEHADRLHLHLEVIVALLLLVLDVLQKSSNISQNSLRLFLLPFPFHEVQHLVNSDVPLELQ